MDGIIEKNTRLIALCFFLLLRSDELSVFPNIVVVFIRERFGLPFSDKICEFNFVIENLQMQFLIKNFN